MQVVRVIDNTQLFNSQLHSVKFNSQLHSVKSERSNKIQEQHTAV